MKIALSDFWRTGGTIDRGPFWIIGLIGFFVKYNIDRFIAATYFERKWSIFNYLVPDQTSSSTLHELTDNEAQLFFTFLLIAFPFIWMGVVLTLRRLRAIGWPNWLVAVFFLPFVNLLFFGIIGFHPNREGSSEAEEGATDKAQDKDVKAPEEGKQAKASFLDRLIPSNALGSAALGVFLTVLPGVLLVLFSVEALAQYGLGLFVGIPFTMGLVSVLIYGYHQQRSFMACAIVAVLSVTLFGICLLLFAIEGAICILMATPLGGGLAFIGGSIGWVIQSRPGQQASTASTLGVLFVGLPMLMGAEYVSPLTPPLIEVRTSIDIDAPPSVVWNNVIAFSELPKPTSRLFKLGIAYPIKAEIKGRGVGAVRHCVFSTGPFVEPITVWNENKELRFTVTEQPPAMRESNPWGEIDAPHLNDYLVSKGGRFLLSDNGQGGTHLEGTTWYRHNIWPQAYWQVWSDMIIHGIHSRVLRHIKTLSEEKKIGD